MSNATKLPNSEREQNYRRQNAAGHGKNKLSNRQKRRLRKHDPKWAENLERINNVAKATFSEPTAVPPTIPIVELPKEENDKILEAIESIESSNDAFMNSIDLPEQPWETNECPRCGAKGDEDCVTPKGAKAAKPHAGREAA